MVCDRTKLVGVLFLSAVSNEHCIAALYHEACIIHKLPRQPTAAKLLYDNTELAQDSISK